MIIYPAMDLMNQQVVRLKKGEFKSKKIYQTNPVVQAKLFASQGATHLHVVDLDGAKTGIPQHLELVKTIKQETGLVVQYGGGLRSEQTMIALLNEGIDKIVLGSFALTQPSTLQTLIQRYPHRIVVAIDVKENRVTYEGWQKQSELILDDYLITLGQLGVTDVLVTDIAKDGMLQGIDLDLYLRLKQSYPSISITASGGVTTLNEVKRLKAAHLDGLIIGVALYEGVMSLPEVLSC
jgi:phosphoribosylformimino-5-aminoimidazole carboxamide ribotide isomerase